MPSTTSSSTSGTADLRGPRARTPQGPDPPEVAARLVPRRAALHVRVRAAGALPQLRREGLATMVPGHPPLHLDPDRPSLFPDSTGKKTVSHFAVEMEMPFWLWPLRFYLQRKLTDLKVKKDKEDMAMIERRAKIYGRGNIASYLAPHQFMLHKEAFVEHFGSVNGTPG